MDRSHTCPTCGRSGGPRWYVSHLTACGQPVKIRPTKVAPRRRPDTRKRTGRTQVTTLPVLPDLPERPRERWQDDAACRGLDPDLFFPERRIGTDHGRQVRALCFPCPVRGDCLAHALTVEDHHGHSRGGWWGGLSPKQIGKLRRDLQRLAGVA